MEEKFKERLNILKDFMSIKSNLEVFRKISFENGIMSFYYSSFVTIFLATGDLEYTKRHFMDGISDEIEGNDEQNLASAETIIKYYTKRLSMTYTQAYYEYVKTMGKFAFHGFTNINSTISKEGLKIEHSPEEERDIHNLPWTIKSLFFPYYFSDSVKKINLATLPTVAVNFSFIGCPEWFKMFCTDEQYPFSYFFNAGRKKTIKAFIERRMALKKTLSCEDKDACLKFFEKYWSRYKECKQEHMRQLAIVCIDKNHILDKTPVEILDEKTDVMKKVGGLIFNNFTIDHDIGKEDICLIDVPEPKFEKNLSSYISSIPYLSVRETAYAENQKCCKRSK